MVLLFRLIAASVLVLSLDVAFAKPIATALLPFYSTVFQWIAGDYRIVFLGLATEGADSVIRLDVALAHAIAVRGHLVMPDPQGAANVTTMIGHILQPATAGLIAILAWPARSGRIILLRFPPLIMLCLAETMLDIPLFFAGELWGLFIDNLSPGSWSPLLAWADFLENGGRFALGLAAGLASVTAADYAARKSGMIEAPIKAV